MRVLVAVVPVAGHVGPVSGLVAELVRRGHEVRVYTGMRYARRFTDLGATVVPMSAAAYFDERQPPTRLVLRGFIGTAAAQVDDLIRELDRDPPDVGVSDTMSFGGALVAERRRVPWATLNVLPFNPEVGGPPPGLSVPSATGPLGRVRDRLLWLLFRAVAAPANRAYQQQRARLGMVRDRRPYGTALFSDSLVLATGSPGLDGGAVDRPDQIHYVGVIEPAGLALPSGDDLIPADRPLVLVTQGTIDLHLTDLVQPALRGLADLDVDVLATTGQRRQLGAGLEVPANARVTDLVDFRSVLARTSVLVTNGGWGGVLAAIAAGVPLVIAARGAADKPAIAARVAAAGAGINLRTGRPRPAAVAAAVRTILDDPRYADRARALGAELRQLGGAATAADLLERLAETNAPVRRHRHDH